MDMTVVYSWCNGKIINMQDGIVCVLIYNKYTTIISVVIVAVRVGYITVIYSIPTCHFFAVSGILLCVSLCAFSLLLEVR